MADAPANVDRRAAFAGAALVFVVALAIYVPTLPAGVSIGDTAEAQTVPYILGIAHPTGFPAYTLIGWLFSHVVAFGTVAWRLNAFAAVCTATAASGIVLLACAAGSDATAAAFAALVFALGFTVWNGAILANVQVFAGTCSIYALAGAVFYARFGDRRSLIAACAFGGIGLATHPMAIWIVPGLLVALVWQPANLTPRTIVWSAAALLLPLFLYAYLPLRSASVAASGVDPAAHPPLSLPGGIMWDSNAPRTLPGFLDEVLGRHEGAGQSLLQSLDPHAIPEATSFWYGMAALQYSGWLLALAAVGALTLGWRDLRSLSVLAAGTLGGITFANAYNNDIHIDRYVFVSFAVTAVLAAAASRLTLPRVPAAASAVRNLVALGLALLAGLTFASNHRDVGPTFVDDGERIIAAVRAGTPDGAIVVAQWNDAAPLAYGAFVEHTLGSRIIVAGWPSDYLTAYPAWTRVRRVVLFLSPLVRMQTVHAPLPIGTRVQPLPVSLPRYSAMEVLP